MCPVTDKYITAYVDRNQQPIIIREDIAADVEKNAYEVLNIAKRHPSIILPKVFDIYASLVEEITNEKSIEISNS